MTMIVGFTSESLALVAQSSRPLLDDGEKVWHLDDRVQGVSIFDGGAVATGGYVPSGESIHAAMTGTDQAPLEQHVARIRRVQARSSKHSRAALLTVDGLVPRLTVLEHGELSPETSARHGGVPVSLPPYPPVRQASANSLCVLPPVDWPRPVPAEFNDVFQRVTRYLQASSDSTSADDIGDKIAPLFAVTADVCPSVATGFQMACFLRNGLDGWRNVLSERECPNPDRSQGTQSQDLRHRDRHQLGTSGYLRHGIAPDRSSN